MSSIHMICGLSGSGKTTFVDQLGPWFGNHIRLESDAITNVLCSKDYTISSYAFSQAIMSTMTEVFLRQNINVIVDDVFITERERSRYINMSRKHKCPIFVHFLHTPWTDCCINNTNRERQVPDHTLEQQRDLFEVPLIDEGFTAVYTYKSGKEFWQEELRKNHDDWIKRSVDFFTEKGKYELQSSP